MGNQQIMKKYLEMIVIQSLCNQGFTGKYPHFRRNRDGCIELIAFQTNKYGSSFTVEVSAVFPDSVFKNYIPCDSKTVEELTVWDTNQRYRLKGMYDGWFYYNDVYAKYIFGIGKDYFVTDDNHADAVVSKGYRLVQRFNEKTAALVCNEVNKQLVKAFIWLDRFEKRNYYRK